ncbi:MAG: DUF1800 domain-containing protein [Pseudomonadota bacterium]
MKHSAAALLCLGLAGLPCHALPQSAAQQLLQRTGFTPTSAEIRALASVPSNQAIDRLVREAARHTVALTPAPAWVNEDLPLPKRVQALSADDKRVLLRQVVRRSLELQSWWMQEMLSTPAPLTERMTLFWHGHFTSSLQGVRSPQLLYRQNVLLRSQALGNYRELLHAIARDPAMLIYLNNQQNRKGEPNENFARELLELFTLGEGHYSEADIKEAARAFTGWKTLPPDGRFTVVGRQHDDAMKQFLGERGRFDGDDIIDIILKQPRAAEFIVEALWREFISPQPDPQAVSRLSAAFRRNWDIAPLLQSLLREPAFTAQVNTGSLVKSPVEFIVGSSRALGLTLTPWMAAVASADMGQALFNPPNVKGWPQGEDWITSQWLLSRRQFVLALAGHAAQPQPRDAMNATAADAGPVGARDIDAIKPGRLRKLGVAAMQGPRSDLPARFAAVAEDPANRDMSPQLLVLPAVQPPIEGAKPTDRLESWLLDPVYNLK